jgi:hypothetical protein
MITKNEVKKWAAITAKPAITIYVPTQRVGDYEKSRIHLKNAIQEVEKELDEYDLKPPRQKALLDPIRELLEDTDFWANQSDTLLLLRSEDDFEQYRLPVVIDRMVQVTDTFYLHPTLPVVGGDYRFFVLALSQNEVRFFEGHRYSMFPVKVNDLVPENKKEMLADLADDARLQHHSAGTASDENTIFHGQGSHKDLDDNTLEKFLRAVDDGLMEMLHDETPPLVIAGDEAVAARYRSLSNYPNVWAKNVPGNPEEKDPVLLHEEAMNALQSDFDTHKEDTKKNFGNALSEGDASIMTDDIVRAAGDGRIRTLFLVKGAQEWGRYDPSIRKVAHMDKPQAGATDLIEYAAMQTFLQGGRVYQVDRSDMPRPTGSLNAVFRY